MVRRVLWGTMLRGWLLASMAAGTASCGGGDPAPPVYPPQPPPAQSGAYAPTAAYGQQPASGGYAQSTVAPGATVLDPRAWLLALGVTVPPDCRVGRMASGEQPAQLVCDGLNYVYIWAQQLRPNDAQYVVEQFGTIVVEQMRDKAVFESFGSIPCTLPGGVRSQCSIANGIVGRTRVRVLVGYVSTAAAPAVVFCLQVPTQPGALPPCPLFP